MNGGRRISSLQSSSRSESPMPSDHTLETTRKMQNIANDPHVALVAEGMPVLPSTGALLSL
jgi:hypothetical protein